MANEEHLEILKRGIEVWNRWSKENPNVRPDLSGATLSYTDLSDSDLSGADLSKAHLTYADLCGVDFRAADLRDAVMRHANLSYALLCEADLSGADLSGTNLREAHLSIEGLREADLSGAILHKADLRGVNLCYVFLSGADLCEADLSKADLSGARLTDADLRLADLTEAIFTRTNLDGADFREATVGSTTFKDVDLSKVRGLETLIHYGSSSIDIDTIYRSKGKIPQVFLRGAGVPDSMIQFMHSLVRSERAIDYYSCFISYSSRDHGFAERLHTDLQANGVRCWFAPEDMKIGDKIRPTLDQSVRMHDKLLIILSANSVESDWVEQEVETALARERQGKSIVLFPIRLDDAVMEIDVGWPALIRNTRHIGDFRNWKDHDAYQQAFGRLLRDLKSEEGK